MDAVTTHIIGKNSISFQYSGSGGSLALQQALNRWVEQKWVPGLEQELDKYNTGADTIINIDRLEVEINIQQQDDWLENLLPVLLNEIASKLKQYTGNDEMHSEETPVSKRDSWTRFTGILSHFLTTGTLPWNVPKPISANFKVQLADWLQHALVNELWVIIQDLKRSSALKRFFSLLSNNDFIQLISRLTDIPVPDIMMIENDLTVIKNLKDNNSPGSRYNVNVRDWRQVFIGEAILHRYNSKKLLPLAVTEWLQQDPIRRRITKPQFPLHILQHTVVSKAVHQIQKVYPAIQQKQKGVISDQGIAQHNKPGAKKLPGSAAHSKQTTTETPEPKATDFIVRDKTDAISREGIYIPLAGTVIIAAFLPVLLERTSLAANGKIKDAGGALHLIYYAVTGKERPAEFELVLPKILCGLKLQDAVETGTELSPSGKSEADDMLRSVIEHWKVLGNTSVEGLRSSFLQREGKIKRLEKGEWQLMVQQEAYDMLLQQLPWSISIIRLPWMEQNLITHWI
ncbi:MAG TPA: contractile injection system tape measure protein [Niabella sp.]|nr:contractile injection system tape measure protein [Niabella sp.]